MNGIGMHRRRTSPGDSHRKERRRRSGRGLLVAGALSALLLVSMLVDGARAPDQAADGSATAIAAVTAPPARPGG